MGCSAVIIYNMYIITTRLTTSEWIFIRTNYIHNSTGGLTSLLHLTNIISLEFCKNTNIFEFKNGRKCFDAQNLPDVTVSMALTSQIFPQR